MTSFLSEAGEEDELHQHTEAEAHDGNPDAQTWLAKKYFWGLGGVARNEFAARCVTMPLTCGAVKLYFLHPL